MADLSEGLLLVPLAACCRVQRTRQGRLIVTTHRLLHLCHASPSEGSRAGLPSDMPSQLPLACLSSITVKAGGKATRGAPPVLEGKPLTTPPLNQPDCIKQGPTQASLPPPSAACSSVTCKNQLTYLYQVQAPCDPLASPTSRASSSSSQGPLPSSLSDYSQLSPQPSPPLLPPAFEAEQLVARLRAVQEEVLWRQIEDDYAFPAGRSRFFPLATSPSPACSPARTTQPPTTDRQVGGHCETPVLPASLHTEHDSHTLASAQHRPVDIDVCDVGDVDQPHHTAVPSPISTYWVHTGRCD